MSLLIGLVGCQSWADSEPHDALIAEHSAASLSELKQIIEAALPGFEVTLSDTALTDSNQLIIERKRHKSLLQGVVPGRSEEMPEIFTLQLTTEGCRLTQRSTQAHWLLKSARCVKLSR